MMFTENWSCSDCKEQGRQSWIWLKRKRRTEIWTRFHLRLMSLEKGFGYHFTCLVHFSHFALGSPTHFKVNQFQVRSLAVWLAEKLVCCCCCCCCFEILLFVFICYNWYSWTVDKTQKNQFRLFYAWYFQLDDKLSAISPTVNKVLTIEFWV